MFVTVFFILTFYYIYIEPVSYTHLDVYKRQHTYRRENVGYTRTRKQIILFRRGLMLYLTSCKRKQGCPTVTAGPLVQYVNVCVQRSHSKD